MLRETWGHKLREVFDSIEHPTWDGTATAVPLMGVSERHQPLRKIGHERERLI
jgi:putative proteasome-type protease